MSIKFQCIDDVQARNIYYLPSELSGSRSWIRWLFSLKRQVLRTSNNEFRQTKSIKSSYRVVGIIICGP